MKFHKLIKILKKINFDDENVGYDGFEILNNGLPIIKCWSGGDWESPVYFIIYWDGKKFRGYTPENGNTFNPITRTASGSEHESGIDFGDRESLKKLIPELKNVIDLLSEYELSEKIHEIFERYQELEPDWNKMEEDIINRIEIK